jgi:hypothetical protein
MIAERPLATLLRHSGQAAGWQVLADSGMAALDGATAKSGRSAMGLPRPVSNPAAEARTGSAERVGHSACEPHVIILQIFQWDNLLAPLKANPGLTFLVGATSALSVEFWRTPPLIAGPERTSVSQRLGWRLSVWSIVSAWTATAADARTYPNWLRKGSRRSLWSDCR